MNEIESQEITHFAEQAYLDYAMYVILDRALPHIGDGLKPVQRRIVYAMSELSLSSQAKYKKSARTVGDVLGKFHPHGDSACYEAMVLMAQEFSYRYPLIDGQGNWGSIDDPKSFAAMRYTEARLSKFADLLLRELGEGSVAWVQNFDGTLKEPKILPARVPMVLLNGATGIAVGMATDIPPHNFTEVINATSYLIDNPDASVADLLKYIKGPDFPTDAEIITPQSEILSIYESGYGSIKMRAVYNQDGSDIIITALPYLASGSKILEQIAEQMQAKKLPMLVDLRDESDHENPVRLVLSMRSNRVDIDEVMPHLLATTDLERSYRVNFNMLGLSQKPKVYNLKELLLEWLEFRKITVTNRLQYRLEQVNARLHILEGLLIAYLNLDLVIKIIRTEDEPKAVLIKRLKLSIDQADAILEMKLKHLAKLEEIKINKEQQELTDESSNIKEILASQQKLKSLIKQELKASLKEYKDERRSPMVERAEAKPIAKVQTIPSEAITIVLSKKGWIRAGKGHDIDPINLSYKSGDEYCMHVLGNTRDNIVFFDSTGRSYALPAYDLPSLRGYGEPLTSKFEPESGAYFVGMIPEQVDKVLLLSTDGYGFLAEVKELMTKNRKGKSVMALKDAQLLRPYGVMVKAEKIDAKYIALASEDARLLVLPLGEVPLLNKGRGKKLFAAHISFASILNKGDKLIVQCAKRKLILSFAELKAYIGKTNTKGAKLPKGYATITGIEVETC